MCSGESQEGAWDQPEQLQDVTVSAAGWESGTGRDRGEGVKGGTVNGTHREYEEDWRGHFAGVWGGELLPEQVGDPRVWVWAALGEEWAG